MSAEVGEKENVREYNKNIDKQKITTNMMKTELTKIKRKKKQPTKWI